MGKFIIQLLLILFVTHTVFCQQNKINELKSLLATSQDTARVNVLNKLAKAYQFIDNKELLHYSLKAKELAIKLSYRNGLARAVCNIGAYQSSIGNKKEGLKNFRKSLALVDSTDNYLKMIIIYNLSTIEPESSLQLKYKNQSLSLAKKMNFRQIGFIYHSLGTFYYNHGEFSKAYEYYIEGLKVSEKLNDSITVLLNLSSVAAILDTQDDEKSFATCKEAIRVAQKLHNKFFESLLKNDLAAYYRKKGNLDSASLLAYDALNLAEQSSHIAQVIESLSELGYIFQLKENPDKAIKYYNQALEMNSAADDPITEADIFIKLGSIHNLLHSYKLMLNYLNKAKVILDDNKQEHLHSKLYYEFSEAYAHLGEYKKAYEYYKLYHAANDSIYNIEKSRQISTMRTQYEIEKKEQSIKMLSQSNSIKDLNIAKGRLLSGVMIALCACILLVAILLYNLYLKKNRLSASLEKANQEVTLMVKEKEILLQEIHHRVKNNLQLISSLLKWQSEGVDDKKLLKIITEGRSRIKSMALIHESLYQSNNLVYLNASIYLENLLNYLNSLYNKDRGISIVRCIEPVSIDSDHIIPIGLIVTELVTNSFKYAFPFNHEGVIHVSLSKPEPGMHTLMIKDNGIGIPKELNDDIYIKTMGIQLVKTLVKQIKGRLDICNEGGANFTISFDRFEVQKHLANTA